jgi:hypothetical protein
MQFCSTYLPESVMIFPYVASGNPRFTFNLCTRKYPTVDSVFVATGTSQLMS